MHPKSTATRRPATSYRPHIRRLSQGVYEIGSRTIPGALYTVTLTGRSSHTCTCPAYAHGRDCWHHAAARQASSFFSKWYGQAVRVAAPVVEAHAAAPAAPAAPAPIPFHQTAGYKALAACFS